MCERLKRREDCVTAETTASELLNDKYQVLVVCFALWARSGIYDCLVIT